MKEGNIEQFKVQSVTGLDVYNRSICLQQRSETGGKV